MLVLEEAEEGGFVVKSPLDPGLVTQAETLQEAFLMAYDAAECLAIGRKDWRNGLVLPFPRQTGGPPTPIHLPGRNSSVRLGTNEEQPAGPRNNEAESPRSHFAIMVASSSSRETSMTSGSTSTTSALRPSHGIGRSRRGRLEDLSELEDPRAIRSDDGPIMQMRPATLGFGDCMSSERFEHGHRNV